MIPHSYCIEEREGESTNAFWLRVYDANASAALYDFERMSWLPPRVHLALLLRHNMDGSSALTYKQVGDAIGSTPGYARVLINRGLGYVYNCNRFNLQKPPYWNMSIHSPNDKLLLEAAESGIRTTVVGSKMRILFEAWKQSLLSTDEDAHTRRLKKKEAILREKAARLEAKLKEVRAEIRGVRNEML